MTPRLLIIKIQSLLNGSRKIESRRLKHLAFEYQKLYNQSLKRLEQCTVLVKTNRDYLALDLVESEPPLLDTISVISFPEQEKWLKLCSDNDIEITEPFDEEQIELLQSLYTKDIGQNHPLYRDYRRAMRMHNTRNALKIIGTISKINSTNFDIQQEYLRLLSSEINVAIDKLSLALKNEDKQEALDLYAFLDAHKSDFNREDWDSLEVQVIEIKKEEAILRKEDIFRELKDLDVENQWALAFVKIQELKFLEADYSFSLSEEEEGFLKEAHAKVEAKKRASDLEKLRKNITQNAKDSLSGENRSLSLSARISIYKKLLSQKKYIDKKVLKDLKSRLFSLRKLAFIKLLSQCAVFALIAGGVFFAGKYFNEYLDKQKRAGLAAMRIEQIGLNDSLLATKNALDAYKAEYPEFLSQYALRLGLVESKIDLQESYKQVADSLLAKTNALLEEDLNSAKKIEIESNMDSIDSTISNMLLDDSAVYSVKKEDLSSSYAQKLAQLENAYKAMLTKSIQDTQKYLSLIDFDLSQESVDAILKSNQVIEELQEAKALYISLFKLHDMDKIKIDELVGTQIDLKNSLNEFIALKKALSESLNLNEYLAELKNMQLSSQISPQLKKSISSILAKEQELRFGSEIKNFSQEEFDSSKEVGSLAILENLPEGFLDPIEIYVYDDASGEKQVYTEGLLQETKSTWTGGYEIVQRGKEYSPRGTSSHITKKKLYQVGKMTDEIYKNPRLSKEAEFVGSLKEERYGLLMLINTIYASDIDPQFKLWLESKIFEEAKKDSAQSGLMYSSIAKDRADVVEKNARGLTSMSWLRQDNQKKQELKYNLYSAELANLEKDALARLNIIKELSSKNAEIIGFVDENGVFSINLEDFADVEIYGINTAGAQVLLVKDAKMLTKAAAFSPLVIRN